MMKALVITLSVALVGCKTAPMQTEPAAAIATPVVQEQKPVDASPAKLVQAPVEQLIQEPVVEEAPRQATNIQMASLASTPPLKISSQTKVMDSRMDKVIKLINSSSGARQVLGSNSAKAHEYHEKSKALYRQAQNSTDKAEVSRLLNESVKAMYVAIRAASPASVFAEKDKRDFDKLQRSVDTFMGQHERISDEKGMDADGKVLRSQVAMMSQEARRVFDKGEHEKGQTVLREAFDMLRDSIGSMRGGDTLVRSLNFANKEEEYNYELEKYKSQLVLVDVLLASKRESSKYVAKKVAEYIAVAESEREKGESQAAAGSFDEAVKSLENARKQVVRALRTGGIFVPG